MSLATRVLASILLAAAAAPLTEAHAQGRSDLVLQALPFAQHFPDEVIVQFRAGTSDDEKNAAAGRVGGARQELLVSQAWRGDGKGDLELLRIPPGVTVAQAIGVLEADAAVEFAEPNWVYEHQDASNDDYYVSGALWGMYGDATTPSNAFGSQAGEAWNAGYLGTTAVAVGVIDEGIMYSHADLVGQVWTNPNDPVDGVDNDRNGYVDDVHGWDFTRNDNTVYDGTQDDHATHVAGTIGAKGGNEIGVAGVNWHVTLISAKFLGRAGGTTSNAIKAVNYITDLKVNHGVNVVATNNSWGGGGYSQGLLDAINAGGDANILFVAAAGNGGNDFIGDDIDTTPQYPASYKCKTDCLIAVAAIQSDGELAYFSNYGATSVLLGAPGVGIWSTVPGRKNASSYASYSGTSMATPHVTGAAALYASTHPGATPKAIRDAIHDSANPTSSLSGKTSTGGRLDVNALVNPPPP